MATWYEREEQQLADDYAAGLLTLAEYNKAMRELQREINAAAREEAEGAADRAYRDTFGNY